MADVALSLVKVHKAFGGQAILDQLSFGLEQGEKVGLIGRNGAGKSTLFKLLSQEDTPDSGEVIITQGLRVARLSQDPHFAPQATIRQALEEALEDHAVLIRRHGEIHEALQDASAGSSQENRLHQELERVEHHLAHMGWDLEPRLKAAQSTWGLVDLEVQVESLSGGWRKRVALAQAWLKDPDVLVLDEPTNHLDPEQVEKLEAWLQEFQGSLLLITHDRHLLDAVVDRMLELVEGGINSYDGSYSDYLLEKSDREFRESRLTDHMQNRLRRELTWLSRGAKARTRKSKLRIQDVLDLKDDVHERMRVEQRQSITFSAGSNRSDSLLRVENIQFAYEGGQELMGGLELILQRGMRVAILGPNGCGKSTLIKLLLGDLQVNSGEIQRHPKCATTIITQGRGELRGDWTVLENLADRAAVVNIGGNTIHTHVYLTRFGFPVTDQARLAGTLSGGERNRLLLAKAMLTPCDLLVLDEPTNDLDIPTLQNLEEALMDFPGTLLLVSHDRFFLDQVATHTLAWNPLGFPKWELYDGNPDTVKSLRLERAAAALPLAAKAKAAEAPARTKTAKKGLSQKEQRRLDEIDKALEGIRERLKSVDEALGDPSAFLRADSTGHQALKDRDTLREEQDLLEMEWMDLAEKQEQV